MKRKPIPILIRPPRPSDEAEFLALVAESRALHRPWVHPPADRAVFRRYLKAGTTPRMLAWLVCRADTGEIAGVINVSEIVRGNFRSAYLGYYAFAPSAGRGIMSAGLAQVIRDLFRKEGLHRVEANIQPGNQRSRTLVERLGFRLEGYSPRYLKIGGRWRDHERWALIAGELKSPAGRKAGD